MLWSVLGRWFSSAILWIESQAEGRLVGTNNTLNEFLICHSFRSMSIYQRREASFTKQFGNRKLGKLSRTIGLSVRPTAWFLELLGFVLFLSCEDALWFFASPACFLLLFILP